MQFHVESLEVDQKIKADTRYKKQRGRSNEEEEETKQVENKNTVRGI